MALPALFVDRDGELVPFFLEDFQIRDEYTALVSFDDVSSEDQAKKLVNSDLYIPRDALPGLDLSQQLASWIVGFKAFDQDHTYIGEVRGLISLKEQDLFSVIDQDKETIIPAVPSYIIRIDRRRKEIHLDLPEGLLDLNL